MLPFFEVYNFHEIEILYLLFSLNKKAIVIIRQIVEYYLYKINFSFMLVKIISVVNLCYI